MADYLRHEIGSGGAGTVFSSRPEVRVRAVDGADRATKIGSNGAKRLTLRP
jgi:hypothetical protein